MHRTAQQLRSDAQSIWWAGVRAVEPQRLIAEQVAVAGETLWLGEHAIDLVAIDRIAIVGAGKAGAGMTRALEAALGEKLLVEKQVTGWVNVPADCVPEDCVPEDCVPEDRVPEEDRAADSCGLAGRAKPVQHVRLHAARPAGVNEPRPEGVAGTAEILRLVDQLGPRDLCLCLISGGGSALLPAPINGLTLASKTALTREISARGGTIEQLNTVRRELSTIKGGGLARACRAGQLVALILSDVLGDDLEVIASGPTVMREPTPQLALQVLDDLQLTDHPAGRDATALLRRRITAATQQDAGVELAYPRTVHNLLIGSNATAVDAAGIEAERLGYSHAMISATQSEGTAESVGAHLVEMAKSMRDGNTSVQGADRESGPDCLISGGEPTVALTAEPKRGKGGRNQQLVLAALTLLKDWSGLALLSGGTDGEDGPTDAAGALIDQSIADAARAKQIDLADYLLRNDAYHCFEQLDGLLKTGPTGTNVCDVRVLVVSHEQTAASQHDR